MQPSSQRLFAIVLKWQNWPSRIWLKLHQSNNSFRGRQYTLVPYCIEGKYNCIRGIWSKDGRQKSQVEALVNTRLMRLTRAPCISFFSSNKQVTAVYLHSILCLNSRWVRIKAELHHENARWAWGIESHTVPWKEGVRIRLRD